MTIKSIRDLTSFSIRDLLCLNANTIVELRKREIVRTSNNPLGDYAERLFCTAFGWRQAANSERDFDAKDAKDFRFQIKARRPTHKNKSRQLSALRRLPEQNFDFLGAFERAISATVNGVSVKIAARRDLLRMKSSNRAKDMEDVELLGSMDA